MHVPVWGRSGCVCRPERALLGPSRAFAEGTSPLVQAKARGARKGQEHGQGRGARAEPRDGLVWRRAICLRGSGQPRTGTARKKYPAMIRALWWADPS